MIECSAKENLHIKDIFRTFLQIGKVPQSEDSSLKRQSSAYNRTRPQHRSQTPPSDREPIPEVGLEEDLVWLLEAVSDACKDLIIKVLGLRKREMQKVMYFIVFLYVLKTDMRKKVDEVCKEK